MGESSHALVLMGVSREDTQGKKEDVALQTSSTEAVFISGAIEVHEGSIVACFDITCAYLHADCSGKGEKFMLLEGQLAELMVLVEPKLYREYVLYSPSGVTILYVKK